MFLWLTFCSVMIFMVCSALISEGFGKVLAAKVAGWSMLAALIGTQVPKIFPELDGRSHNSTAVASYDWIEPSLLPYREVSPSKSLVISESPSKTEVVISENEEGARGIDFTPTCGGGEEPNNNRLDIAELNKQSDKRSISDHSC